MIGLAMTVALCACVQGMDESVLSGAGLFYPTDLKLEEYTSISPALLEGLIGSAPYLAAGAVGCKEENNLVIPLTYKEAFVNNIRPRLDCCSPKVSGNRVVSPRSSL